MIVFLFPIELTYSAFIEEIRSAFFRCCLSCENITSSTPIQLSGPMGKQTLIFNEGDLIEALDEFQDAIDLEESVRNLGAAEILHHSETLPSYEETDASRAVEQELRRSSVGVSENLTLQSTYEDLFKDGGIVDVQLSLW